MKDKPWIIDQYYSFVIDDKNNITLGNYLDDQIKKINNKISTTKNNYGDYMQLITSIFFRLLFNILIIIFLIFSSFLSLRRKIF